MSAYNHRTFPLNMEMDLFEGFRDVHKAGDRAPKGTLTDLATGAEVKLHQMWRKGPLVLEFGSLT